MQWTVLMAVFLIWVIVRLIPNGFRLHTVHMFKIHTSATLTDTILQEICMSVQKYNNFVKLPVDYPKYWLIFFLLYYRTGCKFSLHGKRRKHSAISTFQVVSFYYISEQIKDKNTRNVSRIYFLYKCVNVCEQNELITEDEWMIEFCMSCLLSPWPWFWCRAED